ncbi:hypothetical protein [Hyphobacterium sp.]|uniref:hypothetical protein n=1 Tax=Hyphobacterium sp. TaxID=2004662 RepID=UPI003BAD4E58
MPGWISAMNFVSARLRRAVFVLLIVAVVQASPGFLTLPTDTIYAEDGSITLRRPLD